jgi:lipopolysaccharide transport system permease protein
VKEIIYTPEGQRRDKGLIWNHMIKGVWESRELIWRLFIRDFSVRYRQSVFGYLWAALPPVVTVILFVFLTRSRVLEVGVTSLPYVLYALWGVTVWQLFAGCLIAATNSLANAGALVTKINFPKESLVISAVGQPIVDFIFRLIIVVFVFILYNFAPSWHSIFIPVILIIIVLLALGFGFILSAVNIVLRDIGNFLALVMVFGIFMAPVFYPPITNWPFSIINIINPFCPLLIATHDLLAYGSLSNPLFLMYATIFSIMIFFLGWRIFHTIMPRIAERA